MKKLKITIFAFIIGLTINSMSFCQTIYNFKDGLIQAKAQNKKVLINIYDEKNTWSNKMESVYANENIKKLVSGNFIYVKLNSQGANKYPYNGKDIMEIELAKLFGATGYPSHVFLNADGSIIKIKYNGEAISSFPGFCEAPDFEKLLNFIISGQYNNNDLSKIL